MRPRTTAATLILLALTACSSNGSDKAEPTHEATTAVVTAEPPTQATEQPATDGALEKAVRAYSAAYFKPDAPAAYSMLSARCKAKIPPEAYGTLLDMAAKDYGQQDIKSLTVDQQSGDMARVTYTYAVPKLNQTQQPWTREAGKWRYDGC